MLGEDASDEARVNRTRYDEIVPARVRQRAPLSIGTGTWERKGG